MFTGNLYLIKRVPKFIMFHEDHCQWGWDGGCGSHPAGQTTMSFVPVLHNHRISAGHQHVRVRN